MASLLPFLHLLAVSHYLSNQSDPPRFVISPLQPIFDARFLHISDSIPSHSPFLIWGLACGSPARNSSYIHSSSQSLCKTIRRGAVNSCFCSIESSRFVCVGDAVISVPSTTIATGPARVATSHTMSYIKNQTASSSFSSPCLVQAFRLGESKLEKVFSKTASKLLDPRTTSVEADLQILVELENSARLLEVHRAESDSPLVAELISTGPCIVPSSTLLLFAAGAAAAAAAAAVAADIVAVDTVMIGLAAVGEVLPQRSDRPLTTARPDSAVGVPGWQTWVLDSL